MVTSDPEWPLSLVSHIHYEELWFYLTCETGITGQDGSYLSELLLEKGYQVHGLVRSTASRREALSKPLRPGLTMHLGDMSDLGRLVQILGSIKPDEIYHLAAQSHVAVSFDTPLQTSDTNAMGTLRLLEAMRMLGLDKSTKFYNVTLLYLACIIRATPKA
jgi:GDPmannose 4,6-dehydratase